jgi:hypothetical protein
MRDWLAEIKDWWHQRRLEALQMTMKRQGLWGVHAECLAGLDVLIRPRLKAHYPGNVLKKTIALLHSPTIDHLTSDLYRMAETIRKSEYVDERLAYLTLMPRPFFTYLAHRDGYAISVDRAYAIFHAQAMDAAHAIDSLAEEEEEDTDSRYYLRRYQGILTETLYVYQLFAHLTGLYFPAVDEAYARIAPQRA